MPAVPPGFMTVGIYILFALLVVTDTANGGATNAPAPVQRKSGGGDADWDVLWRGKSPRSHSDATDSTRYAALTPVGRVPYQDEAATVRRAGIQDLWRDFARFARRKRRPRALIMGSGPSAGLTTMADAAIAALPKVFDIWSTNSFIFHERLVPTFHHVEMKPYTRDFWLRNFDPGTAPGRARLARLRKGRTVFWGRRNHARLKWLKNGRGGPSELQVVSFVAGPSAQYYTYDAAATLKTSNKDCCARKAAEVRLNPEHTLALRPNHLTKLCGASLTVVLDMVILLGYEEIYFLGVDLHSHHHFWDTGHTRAATLVGKQFWVPPEQRPGAAGPHDTGQRGVQSYLANLNNHLSAVLRLRGIDTNHDNTTANSAAQAVITAVLPFVPKLRRPFVNLAPKSLLAACGIRTADARAVFARALTSETLSKAGHNAGADGVAGAAVSAAVWGDLLGDSGKMCSCMGPKFKVTKKKG